MPCLRQQHQYRLQDRYLFSEPSTNGLSTLGPITAGSTDDANGADGMFAPCGHPDHSRPTPTFTRERDLDTERPQERLRPPQPIGECPRIFGPCWAPRDVGAFQGWRGYLLNFIRDACIFRERDSFRIKWPSVRAWEH